MSNPTLNDALDAIARSLREFGYPDASLEMMRDTWAAFRAGKRDADLPHGIVGMFAARQMEENEDWMAKLP